MIPPGSKALFDKCTKQLIPSPTPTRRLYVGTPGIGKSFSSAYLIRLLMEKEVPFIIYETQKDTDRYAIALKNKEEACGWLQRVQCSWRSLCCGRSPSTRQPSVVVRKSIVVHPFSLSHDRQVRGGLWWEEVAYSYSLELLPPSVYLFPRRREFRRVGQEDAIIYHSSTHFG